MPRQQRTPNLLDPHNIQMIEGRRKEGDLRIEAEIKLSNGTTKIVSTKMTEMVAARYVSLNLRDKLETLIRRTGSAALRKGRTPKQNSEDVVNTTAVHPAADARRESYKPVRGTFGYAATDYRAELLRNRSDEGKRLKDAGEPQRVITTKAGKHTIKIAVLDSKLMPVLKHLRFFEITRAVLQRVIDLCPNKRTRSSFGDLTAVYEQVMQRLAMANNLDLSWPKFIIPKDRLKPPEERGSFEEYELRTILSHMTDEWVEEGRYVVSRETRRLMRAYLHIAVISGIRPGLELDRVRFGDIARVTENRTKMLLVHVRKGQGKTKADRDAFLNEHDRVCSYSAALADIEKVHGGHLSEGTRIFQLPSGALPHMSAKISALIKELGLSVSREGKRRPAYSARHTYANNMLEGANVLTLSKAMGNSVGMMETHYVTKLTRRALAGLVVDSPVATLSATLKRDASIDEHMTDEDANADPDVSDELAHGVRHPWQEEGYLDRISDGFSAVSRLMFRHQGISHKDLEVKIAALTKEEMAELVA